MKTIINYLVKKEFDLKEIHKYISTPLQEYLGLSIVEFIEMDKKHYKVVLNNLKSQLEHEAMGA